MTTTSSPPLRRSLRSVAGWIWRRVRDGVSAHSRFIFLSPPFLHVQRVLNKASRTITPYRVRDYVDFMVLRQVFDAGHYDIGRLARGPELEARYQRIVEAGGTPLIIDCGANIGASPGYFADRFPRARVVAIEPEPGNFKLMRMNCRSERIVCLNAAVASTAATGRVVDPGEGNWGFRVEPSAEGDVRFVSIGDLLRDSRWLGATPFIVKIDIEGFEAELFSANTDWIDRFPLMIVELHDWLLPKAGTSHAFLKAISALNRDFVHLGENIFSIANLLM